MNNYINLVTYLTNDRCNTLLILEWIANIIQTGSVNNILNINTDCYSIDKHYIQLVTDILEEVCYTFNRITVIKNKDLIEPDSNYILIKGHVSLDQLDTYKCTCINCSRPIFINNVLLKDCYDIVNMTYINEHNKLIKTLIDYFTSVSLDELMIDILDTLTYNQRYIVCNIIKVSTNNGYIQLPTTPYCDVIPLYGYMDDGRFKLYSYLIPLFNRLNRESNRLGISLL